MYKYRCLNPISHVGLDRLDENYVKTEDAGEADVILVRSAKMHDMEFGPNLKAIARAGAGVNNIPLDRCAEEGIVVFNTPGANANGVKELVIAGMLLAARDIIGGINWVQEHEEDGDIAKITEKKKKAFAGTELQGKKLGDRSGRDRRPRCERGDESRYGGIRIRSVSFRGIRMEAVKKHPSCEHGR